MLIRKDNILLFDMDGTLVNTDIANNLSYQEAISTVLGTEIVIAPNVRITSKSLKDIIPTLNNSQANKIIELKQNIYSKYLINTQLITKTHNILIEYHQTNMCILVTNSKKERAITILKHHNLFDKFQHVIFNHSTNKYLYTIKTLNLDTNKIIVFENEDKDIHNAINSGINQLSIFKI